MSIEAMRQALEVLTDKGQLHPDDYKEKKNEAITALRAAIEQAEKLVTWVLPKMHPVMELRIQRGFIPYMKQRTPPPAAQWVGLTEEEIDALWFKEAVQGQRGAVGFARAIEAKLKARERA